MNVLSYTDAEKLAAVFHADQTDKAGAPYVGHLRRVAARVTLLDAPEAARMAAVLHDCVEDGHTTLEELTDRFAVPSEVVEIVDALTRRPGESYQQFVARCIAAGALPALVKLCDIADNFDAVRLARLGPARAEALRARYQPHFDALVAVLAADWPLYRIGVHPLPAAGRPAG